jgi:glycolate oxidase FAD binding subunit
VGVIDLDSFAEAVGAVGEVAVQGHASRGGAPIGVRTVSPPSGIQQVQPDEMTVCCAAGTPVDDLVAALAEHRQTVALPVGGTVGGALAVGRADVRRLGWGPVRDVLLQARYVSAEGRVVKVGGPTVKNVSGFDLCRLLVGSRGTLGFVGEVLLRTRPVARASRWFVAADVHADRLADVHRRLYRPTSLLWNGHSLWALLEGHPADVAEQARAAQLVESDGPPELPSGGRWSVPPAAVASLRGTFVAEVGVGVVHHFDTAPPAIRDPRVVALAAAVKRELDPTGRLNPGLGV